MAGTLDGKRAIVTGGALGGRGIALALAAEGAAVALVGRTEAKLFAVAAEISKPGGTALPVVADVTRPTDIQRCVTNTVSVLGGIGQLAAHDLAPQVRGHELGGLRHPDPMAERTAVDGPQPAGLARCDRRAADLHGAGRRAPRGEPQESSSTTVAVLRSPSTTLADSARCLRQSSSASSPLRLRMSSTSRVCARIAILASSCSCCQSWLSA